MIRVEDLVEGLVYEPSSPPVADSESAYQAFQSTVDYVAKSVTRPIRWFSGSSLWDNMQLFSMVRSEPSVVTTLGKIWNHELGVIDPADGQEILFKVMRRYGLNEEVQQKKHAGLTYGEPRMGIETIEYPSQTIPGLVFLRERGYLRESGDSTYVNWWVQDKAPAFRFDIKRLIDRKPKNIPVLA